MPRLAFAAAPGSSGSGPTTTPTPPAHADGAGSQESAVQFVDERTDMAAVYSAFDVFVLASYREGFSRASMEAAACGLPMVLSDIRGCREIGTDGEHLLLASPTRLEGLDGRRVTASRRCGQAWPAGRGGCFAGARCLRPARRSTAVARVLRVGAGVSTRASWQWLVTVVVSTHRIQRTCAIESWSSRGPFRIRQSPDQRSYSIQYVAQTVGENIIWAVVVTFARPKVLDSMLAAMSRQTRRPDHVLVVDNGSDCEVARVAATHGAEYTDSGENIGPAGGNALALSLLLPRASDDDWILFVDDDDLPGDDALLQRLESFGRDLARSDPRLAGVGIGGSTYRRQLGIFKRLEDHELTGTVELGRRVRWFTTHVSSRRPTQGRRIRRPVVLGLRGGRVRPAPARAWVTGLCAPGPLFLQARQRAGTAGISARTLRTPSEKAAWRRYYSVRNSTVLARRYGGPLASTIAGVGGAAKGAITLARGHRPFDEIILPGRGAVDAFRGRLGRRVDPGAQ